MPLVQTSRPDCKPLRRFNQFLTAPWVEDWGLLVLNPQVLRVAKSNPEKLHEIIHTLTNHCIKVSIVPRCYITP